MAVPDATLDPVVEAELWRGWRERRDVSSHEQLVLHHLPYARVLAATLYLRRVHDEIEFAEYLQFALVGMLEAVDRYDPSLGAKFRTFASRRMQGAVLDGLERLTEKQQQIATRQRLRAERLRDLQAGTQPPVGPLRGSGTEAHAEALFRYLADISVGLAIGCMLEGTGMVEGDEAEARIDKPYQQLEMKQLKRQLLRHVDSLSAHQRTVIRYHYLQQHGFDDIAGILGVTKGRVSQIHREALQALRAGLNASAARYPHHL